MRFLMLHTFFLLYTSWFYAQFILIHNLSLYTFQPYILFNLMCFLTSHASWSYTLYNLMCFVVLNTLRPYLIIDPTCFVILCALWSHIKFDPIRCLLLHALTFRNSPGSLLRSEIAQTHHNGSCCLLWNTCNLSLFQLWLLTISHYTRYLRQGNWFGLRTIWRPARHYHQCAKHRERDLTIRDLRIILILNVNKGVAFFCGEICTIDTFLRR